VCPASLHDSSARNGVSRSSNYTSGSLFAKLTTWAARCDWRTAWGDERRVLRLPAR